MEAPRGKRNGKARFRKKAAGAGDGSGTWYCGCFEGNPLQGELDSALRRLEEVTMENELLWRRVREKTGPLARRRSSK